MSMIYNNMNNKNMYKLNYLQFVIIMNKMFNSYLMNDNYT